MPLEPKALPDEPNALPDLGCFSPVKGHKILRNDSAPYKNAELKHTVVCISITKLHDIKN